MVLQKTQRASSEVIDSSVTASAKAELKILVSAVQFRPWPPLLQPLTHESREVLFAAREFRVTRWPSRFCRSSKLTPAARMRRP
jgi:hypothetical protein